METQYINCKECKHKMSNKNYAISRHVKKHNLELYSYIRKHYKLTGDVIFHKCSFCEMDATPTYKINHNDFSYEILYDKGYACNTLECKKQISLDILGIKYDSKKYEKIGSRSDYLSKLYGITIDESKKMKYDENAKHFDNSLERFIEIYGESEGKIRYEKRLSGIIKKSDTYSVNLIKCNLDGFVKKYGQEIGEAKYKERCEKISYTNTLDYYVKRFGEEEGKLRYKNKLKQTTISKKSSLVNNLLDMLNIAYLPEENIGVKSVDYYLPEYNIVIEYYGDYWHCNPKKYESNFFHPQIKLTAKEIWNKDKIRLDMILNEVNSVIIIWEDTNIDSLLLEKTINNIKNKKTIIYI